MILNKQKHIDEKYSYLSKYGDIMWKSFWTPAKYQKNIQKIDVPFINNKMDEVSRECVKKTILASALVEDKVKTFWSFLVTDIPQTVVGEVGAIFSNSECFSSDTEVLTNNGFKLFSELLPTDNVAQYKIEDKSISFVKPTEYISKHYKGEMHLYEGKASNIFVTPKHEIIVEHPTSAKVRKAESQSGVWSMNYKYPVSGDYNSGDYVFNDYHRLLIALQADGSMYGTTPSGSGRRDFSISIKKPKKVSDVKEILNSLGIEYTYNTRESGCSVFNARLPKEIEIPVESVKTFDWIDLTKCNKEFVKCFVNELKNWDSHKRDNSIYYYNTNLAAVNKVQAMCSISGLYAHIGINRYADDDPSIILPSGKKAKSTKTCYVVIIRPVNTRVYPKRQIIGYDDMVYCVTVPDGAIVTRRSGCVSIQGNCVHAQSYRFLVQALNLTDDFENIQEIPCMKGRIEYLNKHLSKTYTPKEKQVLKKLVLFTALVERISLFSQFYIIMSFDRNNKGLKTLYSLQSTTAREELYHYQFGLALINIIKQENPELWDSELKTYVEDAIQKAYKAEINLLDWIFEKGYPSHLSHGEILNFINFNFNEVCKDLEVSNIYIYDNSFYYEKNEWMLQGLQPSEPDFFANPVGGYSSVDIEVSDDELDDIFK